MGYFANGTEGDMYEAEYCEKCVHCEDEQNFMCPVLVLHWVWNYRQCNDGDKKEVLEMFIPTKDCFNEKCKMFHPIV